MKSLNDIFSAFKLNKSTINRISKEVKQAAVTLISDSEEKDLSKETTSLLLDITDKIWVAKARIPHNIALNFKVYEVFPHAYYFQYSLFLNMMIKRIADPVQKEMVWKQLVKYLSAEECYANPVRYALWNYYFKDERTVEECWHGLINARPDRIALLHIIDEAACVPWDLKELVYYNLLGDKDTHSAIFDSMYNCAFVEGGKINNEKAYHLLNNLCIVKSSLDYWKLSRKIKPKHFRKDARFGKTGSTPGASSK